MAPRRNPPPTPGRRPEKPLSPEMLALGGTIRRFRQARKLTGDDVYAATEINPTSLSFIERGRQNLSFTQLVSLARALGTTPTRLVSAAFRSF